MVNDGLPIVLSEQDGYILRRLQGKFKRADGTSNSKALSEELYKLLEGVQLGTVPPRGKGLAFENWNPYSEACTEESAGESLDVVSAGKQLIESLADVYKMPEAEQLEEPESVAQPDNETP